MAVKLRVVGGSRAKVLIPVRGGRKSNKALGRDRRYLTPGEVERLERAVKRKPRNATRDWLLIHMTARHGFRASEIVGLKRRDIDLDKGRMQVGRLKGGVPTVHPLDADTRRALRKIYRETGDSNHVFISERGGPMAREAFQRLVERAGEAAKLGFAVHPHML